MELTAGIFGTWSITHVGEALGNLHSLSFKGSVSGVPAHFRAVGELLLIVSKVAEGSQGGSLSADLVSNGWYLCLLWRKKRLELCVVEENECWQHSSDYMCGEECPSLLLPGPTAT